MAGGDAAKGFDAFKEVLHDMPLSIGRLAVGAGMLALGARWDAGFDATLQKPLADGIAIVAFVRHERSNKCSRWYFNPRLRAGAGVTQEKLAEKMGISSRYFQSIEPGKRWPSIGVLVELVIRSAVNGRIY